MKIKLHMPDKIYDFNLKAVYEKFPGAKYVGEFALAESDNKPIAWFKQAKPNRKLGHKTYFGLFAVMNVNEVSWLIVGRDLKDFKEDRYQTAVLCVECLTYTYSRFRHDMHSCKCGKIQVDGGKAYTKVGYQGKDPHEKFITVKLDLLNNKIVEPKQLILPVKP